jgi:hypothetical protein
LKIRFCTEVPGTFQGLTQTPFPFAQALGKIPILTSIPSHRRVGSPAAIAGRPRPTSGAGPLGAHLEAIGGVGRRRRGSGVGARWRPRRLRLRRGRGYAGQRTTAQASTGPREGTRTVGTCWDTRRGGSPAAGHGERGGLREWR